MKSCLLHDHFVGDTVHAVFASVDVMAFVKISIIKRFRIISESFIVFLISVLFLILFLMIPDRPLLSRISETAILSVTKLHTRGPVPLVVHLIFSGFLHRQWNVGKRVLFHVNSTISHIRVCFYGGHNEGKIFYFDWFTKLCVVPIIFESVTA